MKTKLKYLVLLIVLATIGIIVFQISWLKSSYQISKEKIVVDASKILDEAIIRHKELVADTVRHLLRKTIRPQDIETAVHYRMPDSQNVILGFRTKRYPNASWLSFKVNKQDLKKVQQDPYPLLLERIKSSDLDGLDHVYSAFVGIVHYALNSAEDKLQDRLMRCFYLHQDTATLRRILKEKFEEINQDLSIRVFHLNGMDEIYQKKLNVNDAKQAGSEKVIEVPMAKKNVTLTSKMDSLGTYIKKLNERGDVIYIAKPILDDINTILRNEISIIVLEIKIPRFYVLSQMLVRAQRSPLPDRLVEEVDDGADGGAEIVEVEAVKAGHRLVRPGPRLRLSQPAHERLDVGVAPHPGGEALERRPPPLPASDGGGGSGR